MKQIHLIIGLGNPDPALLHTYHNVGTLAADILADETDFKNYKGIFEYAEVGNAVVVKPLVFMNESGIAAKAAAKMFGVKPKGITVIHDDSDLTVGAVKITRGQSSAGHRGVQSVIDHLGSKDFERVRIGIRKKNEKIREKAMNFVLKPIKKADEKIFDDIFEELAEKLEIKN